MLRKDDYNFKGLTINAVAVISRLECNDNGTQENKGFCSSYATFDIRVARNAPTLESVRVPFEFDRKENAIKQAYEYVKKTHKENQYIDGVLTEVEVPNSIFTGWEDDLSENI